MKRGYLTVTTVTAVAGIAGGVFLFLYNAIDNVRSATVLDGQHISALEAQVPDIDARLSRIENKLDTVLTKK